jgi:DNA-binding XRE family transcriptional regulator
MPLPADRASRRHERRLDLWPPIRTWDAIRPQPVDRKVQIGLEFIGQLILQMRRAAGLSQRALGALAGVHQSTISRLERGQLRAMGLLRLAAILGVLDDPRLGPAFWLAAHAG